MEFQHIDLNQTHIRLTTDLKNNNLEKYILNLRKELEHYIAKKIKIFNYLWSLLIMMKRI